MKPSLTTNGISVSRHDTSRIAETQLKSFLDVDVTLRNQTLLAFDFDGTIAPFVDGIANARPDERAVSAFGRLIDTGFSLAIVTGRRTSDVRDLLPTPVGEHFMYSGLLGAEFEHKDSHWLHPQLVAHEDDVRQLYRAAKSFFDDRVEIQDKRVALSLDHDFNPQKLALIETFRQEFVSQVPGLNVRHAGGATEVSPDIATDKYLGLQRILHENPSINRVSYAGDDPDSDSNIMSQLAAKRSSFDSVLTVGILHDRFPQREFAEVPDICFSSLGAFVESLMSASFDLAPSYLVSPPNPPTSTHDSTINLHSEN